MKLSIRKLAGLLLLVGGILAVVAGGFTYTTDTHSADLGPIELSVEEEETVNVPMWAGVAGIVAGVVLLSIGRRR